ncbi:MAG: 50S ribosomal protein L23 [Flavobacteriaceae bacterium]
MSILIKPIITEKAMDSSEVLNCYTFAVKSKSNKIEIKLAIEEAYNVSVVKVRTMNYPVKRNTKFTKKGMVTGITSAYKKAVVELAEGDNIDLYSNI